MEEYQRIIIENVQHVKTSIREVEVISSKIKKDEEEGGVAGEWKYAAMVMDRSGDDFNQLFTFCNTTLKMYVNS